MAIGFSSKHHFGFTSMVCNETTGLSQMFCSRISGKANDIQSASLALPWRLEVRSLQAFGGFGSVSSREACPLSHLEERGHGLESDLL